MRTLDYDHALYQSTPRQFAFCSTTEEQRHRWQSEFRAELRKAIGLDVIASDLAQHIPTAERLNQEEVDGHMREAWRLQVEPDVALPFFLLRPTESSKKLPLVLTRHGHNHPHLYVGLHNSEQERREIEEGDRDIAVQAVKEGYIALAPTVRGFGETRTSEDLKAENLSSCRVQLMHGLLVGRTPIGERIWDMSRLLDWALTNLPVNQDCVAITGNSGGGTVSLYAGACDERIRVVMPGSYFCTYADSIGSIFHCDCNYVPGILRLGEMYDVAGLVAPRPFCAINGVEDPIFPIDATRHAFEKLKEIYTAFDAADQCRLFEGSGGHRYYRQGAWPFLREQFDTFSQ